MESPGFIGLHHRVARRSLVRQEALAGTIQCISMCGELVGVKSTLDRTTPDPDHDGPREPVILPRMLQCGASHMLRKTLSLRAQRRCVLLAAALYFLCQPAAADVVVGQVASAGFPAGTMSGAVFRPGQWFPVRAQLAMQGTGTSTRGLRLVCTDLDGDRVMVLRPQATLSTEGGSPQRVFTCYGLANEPDEAPRELQLIDDAGQVRERLPMPSIDALSNDDMLLLDISAQPVLAFNRLLPANWSAGAGNDPTREYYRAVVTARSTAADLPDRWFGLEAVDVVVWDEPSADDLKRLPQMEALRTWVRNGGQLVIGVGSAWSALRAGPLAELLPLSGAGSTVELRDLPVFRQRLCLEAAADRPKDRPFIACSAGLASGAMRTLGEFGGPDGGAINLLSMKLHGSGRVTASAVSLRELSALPIDNDTFFAALLELNRLPAKVRENESNFIQQAIADKPLYGDVVRAVGFLADRAARGLLAFVFVAVYIGAATIGAWAWLVRTKRTEHAWTAFTAAAVAASLFSIGAAGLTRGCARGVESLEIVDLESGADSGRAHCLFGYRSPTRSRDALALSGEGGFIRPMTRDPLRKSYFVTADRYTALPAEAALRNTPVRATLKQLEGFWQGPLDGTIRARIVLDRRSGRVTPDSFVVNDLRTDLEGAVLIYTDPRMEANGVPRPAARTTLYDEPSAPASVPPAANIVVLELPAMESRSRSSDLGARAYAELDVRLGRWAAQKAPPRTGKPDLLTLYAQQRAWRASGSPVAGVLLASTRNYHLHTQAWLSDQVDAPLTTAGLFDLEISHWLVSGRTDDGRLAGGAILFAWGRGGGPARLEVNGAPRESDRGITIYRVQVPLEYIGEPPTAGVSAP